MTTKTKQVMEKEIKNLSYDGYIVKGGAKVLTEQQEQAVRRSIIRILETAMEEVEIEIPSKELEEDPFGYCMEQAWIKARQQQIEKDQSILNSVKE